ncbi:hypothetical protein C8Q70DRAFT_916815 [Cubamyces menziesii]|nr:hypothetical protein C8Q70DRAFT_916815 [Cubamyces menziesii]
MLEDLERLLKERGIPFHREGNRLRCFPHVVNISVTHGLSALTQEAAADPAYADALQNDPVKRARQLVTACRASGLRREAFAKTITEGNESGAFGEGKQLRQVQLLRDVSTRWSSTFLMIDRLLELYPVCTHFALSEDIEQYLLEDAELSALHDIREFLYLPHLVQELLSSEQTPTASQALPAYERLLRMLKLAKVKHPKISHAICASVTALEKYMQKTRQTRVYALAMGKLPVFF